MPIKKIYSVALFLFVSVLFIPTLSVNAETHIPAGSITKDTIWTASSSPYILDGSVDISYGYTLTIEPGVIIDTSITGRYAPVLSMFQGSLLMNGTEDKPITVRGLASIQLVQSSTTISHVNFLNMESSGIANLDLAYTHARIGYSSFKGSKQGLHIVSGDTVLATSSIDGYSSGLYFRKQAIFLMKKQPILERFFSMIFNKVNAAGYVPPNNQGILTIRNSSFPNVNSIAIDNDYADPDYMIDAVGNWWGRVSDPSVNSSRFANPVKYSPWLDHEPELTEKSKVVCCSSVLFIPGIESSRLYKDGNVLWEPHRNDNIRGLFLSDDGSSADPGIYSGGPIDNVWFYSIYGKFMKFLDGLVAQGTLGEWLPFGYDWRKSIPAVVLGNEKKATTTESLVDVVSRLASTSKTGKVTIVAHSNGGLVAKYLVKTLADQGKSDLIDSVVSVAVPFLGTPEAIGGILHGDDESLVGGLVLKTSVARQLGSNMPSAYSLLPSKGYFDKVAKPVVYFSSTTISNASNLSDFITDANSTNARVSSSSSDTSNAIKGNTGLMANAGDLHNVLDVYSWPANIAHWMLVGWNAMTTTGLSYGSENRCKISFLGWKCEAVVTHDVTKTNMGDGTVVAKSASGSLADAAGILTSNSSGIVSINLHQTDKDKIAHGNILESSTTQAIIGNILKNPTTVSTSSITSITSKPGVTLGEPDYSQESNYIVLTTYSQVEPHVYDSEGKHTGEVSSPAGTEDLYSAYENNIPGSSVEISENNDENDVTHIYLPDNGQKYTVSLKGTGISGFNFDIDRFGNGAIQNTAKYVGLPVTPMTVASTSIQFVPYSSGGSSTFTSSLPVLVIDTDGDGKTDISAIHDATSTVTTDSYLDSLKGMCNTVSKSHQPTVVGRVITYPVIIDCKSISTRIDSIKTLLDSGKLTQIHDYSEQLSAYVKHRDLKTMTDTDNKELWKMLSLFLSQYE